MPCGAANSVRKTIGSRNTLHVKSVETDDDQNEGTSDVLRFRYATKFLNQSPENPTNHITSCPIIVSSAFGFAYSLQGTAHTVAGFLIEVRFEAISVFII